VQAYYPDDKLAVVVLTNVLGVEIAAGDIEAEIARQLLEFPPIPEPVEGLTEQPVQGRYKLSEFRGGADGFEIVGNELRPTGMRAGRPVKLAPAGGGVFVAKGNGFDTVVDFS